MKTKTNIIVVVGPTASGKTALAIDLAKRYDGEIISADSMQIYKHMNIGTAKPTATEMEGIKHHLIDCVDPQNTYSVVSYVSAAHEAIADVSARGKLPILAGGTGLYVSSLVNDVAFDQTVIDTTVRDELYKLCAEIGVDSLHQMLSLIDPQAALLIHKNNVPRVVRAIEIYKQTGITMTEHQQNSKRIPSRYNSHKIGISYANRKNLYDRINLRVDMMAKNGLIEEARRIYESDFAKTAMQAIGYKELFAHFSGEISLEAAVDNLKQSTRRYAKRQLTWFRKDCDINWFFNDEAENIQLMQKKIHISVDNFLNMCYY